MRITLLAFAAPTLAATLVAQSPGSSRAPAPVFQAVTVDVAAAFQQRYRVMIEPLAFGRFTIGLSGEYTNEPDASQTDYFVYPASGCSVYDLCTSMPAAYSDPRYRAWSFNLHGRWYPRALSLSGQRQSVAFYVGEFIGFHERRTSQPVYYGCPECYSEPPMRPDSLGIQAPQPIPQPIQGGQGTFTQVLRGWEPGAEFGVRLFPMRHVVMDIGGRLRLATLEDYQSGTRPGGLDRRLVVSVGVGW